MFCVNNNYVKRNSNSSDSDDQKERGREREGEGGEREREELKYTRQHIYRLGHNTTCVPHIVFDRDD